MSFLFLFTIGLYVYYSGFSAGCSTVEEEYVFLLFFTKVRLQIHKKLDLAQSRVTQQLAGLTTGPGHEVLYVQILLVGNSHQRP